MVYMTDGANRIHAGVLASRDSLAAQLTVQALFKAVRTAAPGAVPGLRKALALAFERKPRSAAYVGALQRLAIEDRGGTVDAGIVAEAATASGSLQAGALAVRSLAICFTACFSRGPPRPSCDLDSLHPMGRKRVEEGCTSVRVFFECFRFQRTNMLRHHFCHIVPLPREYLGVLEM